MTLKDTKDLKELADMAGKSSYLFAKELVNELMDGNLISGSAECWGKQLRECIDGETPVIDVINAFQHVAGKDITSSDFETFLNLVMFGDYDCPECGGEMEVVAGAYNEYGDGYNTEIERVPIWETRSCKHCEYTE